MPYILHWIKQQLTTAANEYPQLMSGSAYRDISYRPDHEDWPLPSPYDNYLHYNSCNVAFSNRGRGRRVEVSRQAPGLPLTAGRPLVAGDPGSSRLLPIPPAPWNLTHGRRHDCCPNRGSPEGAGGIGMRSGLALRGAAPHNSRPLPDAPKASLCLRSPLSRASRPARSRSEAGASAGRV